MARQRGWRAGFATMEILVVIGIFGALLGLTFAAYRSIRLHVSCTLARSRLLQIGVAMECYFAKHMAYPALGGDLVAELEPFVKSRSVFANPLADEARPGEMLNRLYVRPSLRTLDSPHYFITGFSAQDGAPRVVLNTGGEVERFGSLASDPDVPQTSFGLLIVWSRVVGTEGEGGPQPSAQRGSTISRGISIGACGQSDWEVEVTKPDGSTITRDALQASHGSFEYMGPITRMRVRPKGNQHDNDLMVDGQDYGLKNGSVYTIELLPGGNMMIRLFNMQAGKGSAMGRWHMYLDATGAKITEIK
ncbi:MAG TPA: hypothetical protein VNE39_01250 [Planctomycetota bacterium]|nr:hypothetical protein [Planctomycetota bacterium]